MRTYSAQKAALTRAQKYGPQAVLLEVARAEAEWDETGMWPDGWHRWNIARTDAEFELKRLDAEARLSW